MKNSLSRPTLSLSPFSGGMGGMQTDPSLSQTEPRDKAKYKKDGPTQFVKIPALSNQISYQNIHRLFEGTLLHRTIFVGNVKVNM
jgi:hypothetical protein